MFVYLFMVQTKVKEKRKFLFDNCSLRMCDTTLYVMMKEMQFDSNSACGFSVMRIV
jgi:hypothetical protein